MSVTSRQKLHQQIDQLPDRIVEQIANFTSSIITQQSNMPEYSNWENKDWQEFSLQIFFRKEDEIEYSLRRCPRNLYTMKAEDIILIRFLFRKKLIRWLQN